MVQAVVIAGTPNNTPISSISPGLTVAPGGTISINAIRAKGGTESGGGYSFIKTLTISGTLYTTPTVTTSTSPSVLTATAATLGGNVTATGGQNITANGIVYALTTTNNNPSIGGGTGVVQLATTSPGTGTGAFSDATSAALSVNAQYSYKAYATNSVGTSYGSAVTFYTLANVPSAPTVGSPTTSSLTVAINANSNPSATQFAIQETSGNYVQADGTLGLSAVLANGIGMGNYNCYRIISQHFIHIPGKSQK